jgi:anti-sigma factor RsiW
MSTEHITDDDLDLYSLARLPEPACAVVEEHLLVCMDCQERLTGWDEYARAMRSACRQPEGHSAGTRKNHEEPGRVTHWD